MGNSATKQSRDRPLKKNVHWKTAGDRGICATLEDWDGIEIECYVQ